MTQTIVVSGGTKGIGRAIIEKAAERNMRIITCSRHASDLEDLKKSIRDDVEVHTLVADLADKQETNQFVKFVHTKTDKVDILVNNAGAFVPGQVNNEADGVLEKMIQTNLYSAYHLTRGVLKKMGQGGHIFNMCSTASFVPYVNGGSYCISKFALLGFSKVLREELKEQGIRVTALMPGATLTASWEGVEIPEERFMKAEDVADAVWGAYDLSPRTVMEEIVLRPQLGDL
jgi:short-subunit dehydrogenase